MLDPIVPNWHVPNHVKAYSTTRHGGYSVAPYDSLNLGEGSGDDVAMVARNRALVRETLNMPSEPVWLKQVHGTAIVEAIPENRGAQADALWSTKTGQVAVILTADCMPVLFCDRAGQQVAAAHAGWRGLCAGVLEATLACFTVPPHDVQVWLGPAISGRVYEVGSEVRQAFLAHSIEADEGFLATDSPEHWIMDMVLLARQRLLAAGVTALFGGEYCTFSDAERFFSYRRDHKKTGRMGTFIWIE